MKFANVNASGFITEPRYYFFGWSKSPIVCARPSVILALARARKLLPRGYNFKIWDAQRPRSVQLAMLDSFRRRFRTLHPDYDKAQIEKLVFSFGARPVKKVVRLDTHRNGGSFDLVIVDRKGAELYMGTDHDDLTAVAATDYYENRAYLKPREWEAKKNRRLLKRVMQKAGFTNYSPEWWHWSYDK